jgi:hypothetical protein
MAVAGILSSSIFNILNQASGHSGGQSRLQQVKEGFQQLGQDLQAGNLSQAQSDFATLEKYLPGGQQSAVASSSSTSTASSSGSTSSPPSSNSLSAAVSQLASDLQSGNLTAAQSDFASVQQDLQQIGQQQGTGHAHHHHHHHSENPGSSQSSSQQQEIASLFGQLGQSLSSGNLPAAQQAYSTLQQDFQQFALGNSSSSSTSTSLGSAASANLNVSA